MFIRVCVKHDQENLRSDRIESKENKGGGGEKIKKICVTINNKETIINISPFSIKVCL